jgi:hypothetical protein
MVDFSQNQKIAVQNAILAKVNGSTISMMDVKKRMDMVFYQNYPQLADSNQARLQFYEMSWRRVLMDMIDNELIISDATDKEIKLTDGEVREVVEQRFGPNVMQTLDRLSLTYDEAWKMIKNELIVQRMSWWFIHSKAVSSVTPQDIRQSYRLYLESHPAYSEWKYRVVSIRADEADEHLPEQVYQILSESNKPPEALEEELKKFEAANVSIAISKEYQAKTTELSEIHKTALSALEAGTYGKPSLQTNRFDKKSVYRIFYLIERNDVPAPTFETLAPQLKNELIQQAVAEQSAVYVNKLRKHYGFQAENIIPDDLHPFSLQ